MLPRESSPAEAVSPAMTGEPVRGPKDVFALDFE
jgi:hypothetical protein